MEGQYFYPYFSGGFRPLDKGGGGGGHPDPEIGGAASKKLFSALRASFWSKNKEGSLP